MPDLAKIQSIESKMNAGPEPAPESAAAPPPDGGSSGSGSAPATQPGEGAATGAPDDPGGQPRVATIDHAALRAKLKADRERREDRERRKRREAEDATAKKDREEAAAEKAKWTSLGKDKPFMEGLKEAGRDPLQTYKEMQAEALKAGTPEAKMEAMERASDARFAALQKELEAERAERKAEREAAAAERKAAAERAQAHAFEREFDQGMRDPKYETLTDEYTPAQLFGLAQTLSKNPDYFLEQAADHGVGLTIDDGTFTMGDILSVLKATQDRHNARLEEQRRKRTAATQTSPAGPQHPPAATKPTVNGTAARNAGNAMGNQLAATVAAEPAPRKESREERVKRLGARYG